MPYVVCEPCHDCKYTDCVTVCPCDCFYQDARMLYIDPDRCIDCGACVPECPAEAIFLDRDVPSQWTGYVQLNLERVRELIREGSSPTTEKQRPLLGDGCSGPK